MLIHCFSSLEIVYVSSAVQMTLAWYILNLHLKEDGERLDQHHVRKNGEYESMEMITRACYCSTDVYG